MQFFSIIYHYTESRKQMLSNKPKVLDIKNILHGETGINVMRPSKYGNPYVINAFNSRDDVCDMFELYVKSRPDLIASAKRELKGHNLICCCGPKKRCHAQTWLRIANEEELTF